MEAEHEMELKELRQQLKRVHSKDSKQEEYVRNQKNKKGRRKITSSLTRRTIASFYFFFSLIFLSFFLFL
jgi:hypothetical protein